MGIWGAGIKDNDTSMEVQESFFALYNSGLEPEEIKKQLLQDCASDLADEETRFDVLFSLALCLWEVQALDASLLSEIKKIQQSNTERKILTQRGADEKFLKEREKAVSKLVAKLEKPREKAKKRIKPPVQIDGPFPLGAALTFQYTNGMYGVVIVAMTSFYKNRGEMKLIYTDYYSETKPNEQDVMKAHILAFEWSMDLIGRQGEKYAASNGKAARFSSNNYGYSKKENRERYFDFYSRFFECITVLPLYTQVFFDTSWAAWMKTEDMSEYLDFATKTSEVLEHCYNTNRNSEFKHISEETVGEFNKLLVIENKYNPKKC